MGQAWKLPDKMVIPYRVRVLPLAMESYRDRLSVGDVLDVHITMFEGESSGRCSTVLCLAGIRLTIGRECEIVESDTYRREDAEEE